MVNFSSCTIWYPVPNLYSQDIFGSNQSFKLIYYVQFLSKMGFLCISYLYLYQHIYPSSFLTKSNSLTGYIGLHPQPESFFSDKLSWKQEEMLRINLVFMLYLRAIPVLPYLANSSGYIFILCPCESIIEVWCKHMTEIPSSKFIILAGCSNSKFFIPQQAT